MNIILALIAAIVITGLLARVFFYFLEWSKRQDIKGLAQFLQEQNSEPVRLEVGLFSPIKGSESRLYFLLASKQAALVLANGAEFIFSSSAFLCARKCLKLQFPDMQEIIVYQEENYLGAAQ